MKRLIILNLLIFFAFFGAFGEARISITGSVDWQTLRLDAEVTLDLASAGLRLPGGRTQAESLLSAGYLNLVRPHLLRFQVDSSSTVGDLINRGDFTILQLDSIALEASKVPPVMRPDMRNITESHSIMLSNVSSALLRHSRPSPIVRTLSPVSTARYTGIIFIAVEELPIHGMRGTTQAVPCLFPKIWDSEMNLIYERNMLETRTTTMVRYSSLDNIFQNNPSGLSPELVQIVGERPLRIFAQGVFGINPTDLIIDRGDALLIISSEGNRQLLAQGRVAIILDESVLRYEF